MVAPRTKSDTAERRPRSGARRPTTRAAPPKANGRVPSGSDLVEQAAANLIETVRRDEPKADIASIERAIAFAVEAHGDQKRASGEPYVTHPIAAAQILADIDVDPIAIQAAILHDVP